MENKGAGEILSKEKGRQVFFFLQGRGKDTRRRQRKIIPEKLQKLTFFLACAPLLCCISHCASPTFGKGFSLGVKTSNRINTHCCRVIAARFLFHFLLARPDMKATQKVSHVFAIIVIALHLCHYWSVKIWRKFPARTNKSHFSSPVFGEQRRKKKCFDLWEPKRRSKRIMKTISLYKGRSHHFCFVESSPFKHEAARPRGPLCFNKIAHSAF